MNSIWEIRNNQGSVYYAENKDLLLRKYMQGENLSFKELLDQFCKEEYHINKVDKVTGEIINDEHLHFDNIE